MGQNKFKNSPSNKDSAEVLGTHAANPVLGRQQRKQYEGTIITRIKGRKKNAENSETYNHKSEPESHPQSH